MSRMMDHQHQWVRDLDFLDPHWADAEFRLREQAVSLAEELRTRAHQYDRSLRLVTAGNRAPIASFLDPVSPLHMRTQFHEATFEVYPVGGKEEVLLIEECLRRAQSGVGW